jgi:hypothetical protein
LTTTDVFTPLNDLRVVAQYTSQLIKKDGYQGGDQKTKPFELSINYDQINYGITWKGDFNEHRKKSGNIHK